MRSYKRHKERLEADPAYREIVRERAKRAYDKQKEKNPEKLREKSRLAVRKHRLKNKYGITPTQYDGMLESQGGVCAICKGGEVGSKYDWHVDHCHDTGRVRGILCHLCNTILARRGVTPDMLRAAASYLESNIKTG